MRVHLDVLGWLYILCGVFGILTGASLGFLALGVRGALADLSADVGPAPPTVWLFVIGGATLVTFGALMIVTGRAVVARAGFGRPAALVLAALNLLIVPFGTGLGVYTFWTLLNDDARREFGRPPLR